MVIYTSLTLNKRIHPSPRGVPRPGLSRQCILCIVHCPSLYICHIYTHTRSTACFIIYSQGPWGCGGVSLAHTHPHKKYKHGGYIRDYTLLILPVAVMHPPSPSSEAVTGWFFSPLRKIPFLFF